MTLPPIALLPCRVMFWIAAFLIPAQDRDEWKREWFAEVWTKWLFAAPIRPGKRSRNIYAASAGCFRDAWWHFQQTDKEELWESIQWMRSAQACLGVSCTMLALLVVASGFLPATRAILSPLPYGKGGQLAVVSRTGRMEAMRKGIPADLARTWLRKSTLVRSMAACSFPKRMKVVGPGGTVRQMGIQISPEWFRTIGIPADESTRDGLWISDTFWHNQLHGAPRIVGQQLTVDGGKMVVRGVLPEGFWFLSPSIALYKIDRAEILKEPMLIVLCSRQATPGELEAELGHIADQGGYEFSRTAPHAIFLQDAITTPFWLFGAGVLVSAILVILAYGSRWLNRGDGPRRILKSHWKAVGFFVLKTGLGLLFVLLAGIEIFVGRSQLTVSEALGGPALIWFYFVGCTLVLFASVSDQQSRCRVCQRLLGFPIRIGCPGCLFLDWAGTEFLCPHGHGVLYVPHHVSCWEEADRWILLEV